MIHYRPVNGIPTMIATEYDGCAKSERWCAFFATPGADRSRVRGESEQQAIERLINQIENVAVIRVVDHVVLQIIVDPELAPDIQVYIAKAQHSEAAGPHARVIAFLRSLAPQIANAASYAQQIKQGMQRSLEQRQAGA